MNGFDNFTIRGYVAEHRKSDIRLNYPFPLPPDLTLKQISSLLPPMDSPKCKKRFDMKFTEDHSCPHRLLIKAGPSAVPSNPPDLFSEDKINGTTPISVPAADNALQIAVCTDVGNAGVHSTTKHQRNSEDVKTGAICHATDFGLLGTKKQKALFDLNETPTPENTEALENDDTGTKDGINDNSALQNTNKLPSVEKKDAENKQDPEASRLPVSGNVNCNGLVSPQMEESESIDGINNTIGKRRTPKYRTLSELAMEAKRKRNEIVSTLSLQPRKTKSKKKRKRKESGMQEKENIKISEARKDAPETNIKKLQPRPPSNGKGQVTLDENVSSASVLPESSAKLPSTSQNGTGNFLHPKKRRIFGNEVLKTDSEADQSHEVIKSCDIQKRQKMAKHVRSSSKEEQNLNTVAEQSVPSRNKNAPSEQANQQLSGAKRKKKNKGGVIGIGYEKKSPDKSSAAGKELVLRDTPISTIAIDVTVAAPRNGTEKKHSPKKRKKSGDEALEEHIDADKLCQLKSDNAKRKKQNRRVSFKNDEHDSPTFAKKPNNEHGTSSLTPTKNSNVKDVIERRAVTQKQKKRQRATTGSASKRRGLTDSSEIVGKELVLREAPDVPSPLPRSKDPLSGIHLLCMVASESEELSFLSNTKLRGNVLPLRVVRGYEINAPSNNAAHLKSDMSGMGYDGCTEAFVPSDYVSIDEEGNPFMLGPEDLPLRAHRIRKPAKQKSRICSSGPRPMQLAVVASSSR